MAFPTGETSTELGLAEIARHPAVGAFQSAEWTIDPYTGCELACVCCPVRLDELDFSAWRRFEASVGVNLKAVKAFIQKVSPEEPRGCRVVLGRRTEPWQQAEEKFRLTRSLLAKLAAARELDLRADTRSSLIARDAELLSRIAARGRVVVSFSIACADDRITRLVEPSAPSALRRLSAMEALARAGLTVGLSISPVLPGLDPDELGLEPLLTRAASAGARFASLRWMELAPEQRERLLRHASTAFPESATRIRRVLGRRPADARLRAARELDFRARCRALGLLAEDELGASNGAARTPPTQLLLFSPPSFR